MKTKATINPTIEMTKNTICGMKFESVIEVVNGRSLYLGMKMKIINRIIGIITPIIEYTSGFDELLHARHHTTLNAMAIMMMNVPTPMPNILPEEFWQLAQIVRIDARINGLISRNLKFIFS